MKLPHSEIHTYRRRWGQIAASLPRVNQAKVRKVLGKRIVVNSMGGGCWCLVNFGRCHGLAKSGLKVEHFYGCSAGSMAGFAFINTDFFEESMLQFGLVTNQNDRNVYPLNLLKGLSPFPHQKMIYKIIKRAWVKTGRMKVSGTRLTTVLTRNWNRWTPVGYFLALASFVIHMSLGRKLPLLGEGHSPLYDHDARGPHLKWAQKMGLFPSAHSLPPKSRLQDIHHFAMASMSLWPFLPFFKKDRDCFTDGSLLAHNALPLIVDTHRSIDTLITLPTEPIDNYSHGFLGISGYQKKKKVSEALLVCSKPMDPKMPKRHILWDRRNKPRLGIFDYTNPLAALDEYSDGYQETSKFLKELDLS